MANFKDLTGSVYGKLTVIEKTEPYITPAGNKSVQWLCRCSCGNEVKVTTSALNSGSKRMCSSCTGYGVDLTGRRFDKLVIEGKTEGSLSSRGTRKYKWVCRCDCGTVVEVTTTELLNGKRWSCQVCSGWKADLSARTFDRLTVLGPADDYLAPGGSVHKTWLCQCSCGAQLSVTSGALNDGSRRACRSCSGFDVDLTGQTFGSLTVLGDAKDPYVAPGGTATRRWVCRCECGRECKIVTSKLNNGHTRSCGKCDAFDRFIDLTGQRFENIVVVRQDGWYVYPNGERDARWWCLCDCGNEYSIRGTAIRKEGGHSCGCWRSRDRVFDEDMIGLVFGRLTVLERADSRLSTTGTRVNR